MGAGWRNISLDLPRLVRSILPLAPLVSVIAIAMICSSIIAAFHSVIGSFLAGIWRVRP